jgi:hypothetical protein
MFLSPDAICLAISHKSSSSKLTAASSGSGSNHKPSPVFAVSSIHQPSPTVDFNVSPPTVDVSSSNQVLDTTDTRRISPLSPYDFVAYCRALIDSTATRMEEKLEKKCREKTSNGHEKGAVAYGVDEHVFILHVVVASPTSCKTYYLHWGSSPRSSFTLHACLVEMYGALKKLNCLVVTNIILIPLTYRTLYVDTRS